MSAHLGELAAALADDQLDRAQRDRALAHLVGCPSCRAQVDVQRQIKARLDRLGAPQLPPGLVDRLATMRPSAAERTPPIQPTQPAQPARQVPVAAVRPHRVAIGSGHRTRRVLVGAASLLVVGGGVAYAAGGSDQQAGSPVRPAVEVFTVEHGTTSGYVPLHDPATSAVTAGLGR